MCYSVNKVDDPARALSALPAVGALLEAPENAELIARHGRPLVTEAIRRALAEARTAIRSGRASHFSSEAITAALDRLSSPSLRPVINATGVVLHTNLGRAPLADEALHAIEAVARGYATLEVEMEEGARGNRHRHVDHLLRELLGAEGGLAFNNCAGAVFVMLAALCRGGEVIVARGELVEIGGGFRVPDVMAESGARLVEVGTTNKVYARDYAAAIGPDTRALMVVHRSNFAILGFTHEPELSELVALSRRHQIPLLVDVGSGLIADDSDLAGAAPDFAGEPRPSDILRTGADLVAFSGDKLLGGPQAGLLAGRRALLDRVARHPLARALRADKLTLAGLEATLRLYRAGRAERIPTVSMLATPLEELVRRADRLAAELRPVTDLPVDVVAGTSVPGGGCMPLAELPTRLVLVGLPGAPGRHLAHHLRVSPKPVLARVVDDRTALDVRTIKDEEVTLIRDAVANVGNAEDVRGRERR